ncbi:caspase family protein [Anoxybacillus ayderensis]|uniref:caspase family protein n=1 Tax=Anoxybacillus ayderensis TaxID=265546 RepID=UPI002E2011BC|nr:caspase family protein [Anoxybacillus ayderensis]
MANVKALIVGVSNYYFDGGTDLPFCMNDVAEMKEALHLGLKVDNRDMIILGELGEVKRENFINALSETKNMTSMDDVLIFYFSGHGTTKGNEHYLVVSDGFISTREIIESFEKISARGKIIFLDCCFSGCFSVNGIPIFSLEGTVADFAGKGCAVFASSSANQLSYRHPHKPISVFTSFLCRAIKDRYIVKNGKISLYDIQKLIRLYLDAWNRNNLDKQQYPIFRANMGGTIYFDVQEYRPMYNSRVHVEYDKYVVYSVEPMHNMGKYRYVVKVILKEEFSSNEMVDISLEIVDKVKKGEFYDNNKEKRDVFKNLANIIWIYFGQDERDIVWSNYICKVTWIDDKQHKEWWYKEEENAFVLKGVHMTLFPYYKQFKKFNEENTGNRDDVIFETKNVLAATLNLAEQVISVFNEYKNRELKEKEFLRYMENLIPEIHSYFLKMTDLKISPTEIHEWSEACRDLIGTIYDFALFCEQRSQEKRTEDNLIACMEMKIREYYSLLEKVKRLEEKFEIV